MLIQTISTPKKKALILFFKIFNFILIHFQHQKQSILLYIGYILDLIIVESPAKARTIKNFLGKGYEVIASKGHIRDLPKSRFGITIDEHNELIPVYSVAKENSAVVKEIQELAKKADTIYIATDEDRSLISSATSR